MNWRVPLADIDYGPEEEAAVIAVLRNRWLSMGEITQQFEAEFAALTGSKYAIAVANATAALHLACLATGLGPGNEVILPSLTFVATANAVRYSGAIPVFADIESLDWLTISPSAIEARLGERTRAILVMHYAGFACDMPAILDIAKRHHLRVIEDAAHAVGAALDGRGLGTWGDIGCYSFFSNKNMTTGEGGMLTTDDEALAGRLRSLRSHGMTSLSWDRHQGHAWSYDVVELGFNYRIDEMRSALGRVQLGKLIRNNARRAKLTALYRQLLAGQAPALSIPFREPRGYSCHHILPVLLPAGLDRRQFMEGMKEQGVQTSIHYPPVHGFQLYRQESSESSRLLPITEEAARREVTLPLYPTMQEEQVEWVVRAARELLGAMSS